PDAERGYPKFAPRPVARSEVKTDRTPQGSFARKPALTQRVSAHGTLRYNCHAASTHRCISDPAVAIGQIPLASAHHTCCGTPEPWRTIPTVALSRCFDYTTLRAQRSPPRNCRTRGSSM